MRRPSCDLEWIMRESWWSAKSGSIASKSQILHALVRSLVCRQRWISGDERQKRPRIIKCRGGEKCPRKQGQADTAGSLITEASTSGGKRRWKVCAYCVK